MAISRETFLHDALKVWYEQSNKNAQAIVANNRTAADAFARSHAAWLEVPHTQAEWDVVLASDPNARAFRISIDAQREMASYGVTIAALTARTSLTKEQYEVILEDFRARTAVRVDGKVVSLAESIYTDEIGGGVTSFETKTEFGERFLTGATRRSKTGVLAPRNPSSLEDYTKSAESFEELTRAIAMYDYNEEIREVEIPRETVRAAQMNGIKEFSDTFAAIPDDATEALRTAANNLFAPFSEAGRTLSAERLVEIKNAVVQAQADLEALGSRIYTEKKGVNVDALTGDNQEKFEPIYNSLFGMSNLRDRNPAVVPVYPPLSNIVVNEIARRIQNGTLEADNWLESVKNNPLYPADFTDRAVDHAQRLLEATAAFGMVYQYTDEHTPPTIISPEETAARLSTKPEVATYTGHVTAAVTEYFSSDAFPEAKRNEFAKLTPSQQTVVAQLVAREMTTRSALSTDGADIHAYLATQALPVSIQTLVEDGTFPNFSDLNKFAMTLMLTGDKKPDPAILAGVHGHILTKVKEAGVTEFNLGGTYEYMDGETPKVGSFGVIKDGEIKIENVDTPEFVEAYGGKFYHSGVYGTYGVVEQNQQAAEHARVAAETERVRRESLRPNYDGYKFKFLSKSDYYRQKQNEYYQMYMGSGGPQQYWSMMTAENAKRSVVCKDPTPVEEEVHTEDPPVETPDSKIGKAFRALSGLHKSLVERTTGTNAAMILGKSKSGVSTLSFLSSNVRYRNTQFAGIVLKEVATLIEGKEPDEAAEIIEKLSQPTFVDGKKIAPILPKGVTVSPDGSQVSFFGISYSMKEAHEGEEPTVLAHYEEDGGQVPQSTMITIATHNNADVRAVAPAYMNHPENAALFTGSGKIQPLISTNSALSQFIGKARVEGETQFVLKDPAVEEMEHDSSRFGYGSLCTSCCRY